MEKKLFLFSQKIALSPSATNVTWSTYLFNRKSIVRSVKKLWLFVGLISSWLLLLLLSYMRVHRVAINFSSVIHHYNNGWTMLVNFTVGIYFLNRSLLWWNSFYFFNYFFIFLHAGRGWHKNSIQILIWRRSFRRAIQDWKLFYNTWRQICRNFA